MHQPTIRGILRKKVFCVTRGGNGLKKDVAASQANMSAHVRAVTTTSEWHRQPEAVAMRHDC